MFFGIVFHWVFGSLEAVVKLLNKGNKAFLRVLAMGRVDLNYITCLGFVSHLI